MNRSGTISFAQRPDGVNEPLIWLYNYKPQFDHPFYFKSALAFPAGTRIKVTPPDSGAISLLTGYFNSDTGTLKTAVFTTPLR